MLAALHSGPLGAELLPQIRHLAAALELGDLPETPLSPPADLYRWNYGYCPGNPALGCGAAAPGGCLPAKFAHLAESARKGAAARRQHEAGSIEHDLLPCLETNHRHMQSEAYRDVVALCIAVIRADAAQLRLVGEAQMRPDTYHRTG